VVKTVAHNLQVIAPLRLETVTLSRGDHTTMLGARCSDSGRWDGSLADGGAPLTFIVSQYREFVRWVYNLEVLWVKMNIADRVLKQRAS